jgi:hypothetical protein
LLRYVCAAAPLLETVDVSSGYQLPDDAFANVQHLHYLKVHAVRGLGL